MDGVQLSIDEYGRLVFTADEETRKVMQSYIDDAHEDIDKQTKRIAQLQADIRWNRADYSKVRGERRLKQNEAALRAAEATLSSYYSRIADDNVFLEFIEYWLCNGYSLISPVDIGAIVDDNCLIISDASLDDDGKLPDDAKLWTYDLYAIRPYTDDLIQTGRMVWTLHKGASSGQE